MPTSREAYMTRHKNSIPLFNVKHNYFKNSFFPSTIIEWNNLGSNIRNFDSLAIFKKHILAFVRPAANSTLVPQIVPKTLKYWVGVQRGQSYLMGRTCLFSLGWPPFQWWCHNKNTLWGRCFTSTRFTPHLFLLGWLKLNLTLLDQFRLA